ncbi:MULTISPECIES: cysteine desulfurase [Tissierellales]|jgi:cysteine desulfurase/selenocysteine lyase|uniref:cysteine desulfurase n=1 Tax=Acidilutibacter cellobiosedens TaxID=2507161 RepID=A0A410QB70_9FIRM|nr:MULTISPECIES: cysteine desulfurase [Tissierellales]MBE6081952.1 cysteine desulfurase [Tissierellaceae bacterium]QAT61235.1 cysteine desulfurase [Acidilutibacter cellobiosedens]SCL93442.1 putative cysteine desulfurase [Sporanaerobacter sp. PP17-6a]
MNRIDDAQIEKIRKDFKVFSQKINGKKIVYLDNAATTQRPESVIKAVENYYDTSNANPHRGAHALSIRATKVYEDGREKVRKFINAKSTKEIIFTKNSTEALNLIANSYGMNFINKDDEIVIPISEHHSNLIPWQRVAKTKGAVLKYMYIDDEGRLTDEEIRSKITEKTKLVSIAHVTNTLGVVYPIEKIIDYAHKKGAIVVVDAAQSVPHMAEDVQKLDADFMVFSGHKMLSPMGIGVLYGKENILEKMPPFLLGGDMIEYVSEQDATFAELPFKFEAGTQYVEGVAGLSAAIDYIENLGFDFIREVENQLTEYALDEMGKIPYVTVYGPLNMKDRAGVISFNIKDVHPHDVATIVDSNYGVALRSGHHCAQPLMTYLNLNATCRISFYFYNTKEDVDIFIRSIKDVRRWLGYES